MNLPLAVVFLGGGYAEVELIGAFRANGIRVVLVDRNANAPARGLADEFLNFSTADAVSIGAALQALQLRYCFIGAYGIVDYMFETIRELVKKLRIELNAPSIYDEFTNKLKTKARLERHGILTPRTLVHERHCDDLILNRIVAESESGIVVVKASDACNSEGVRIVRVCDRSSMQDAVGRALALSGEFFCEEFIRGSLHNLDIVLSAGRAFMVAITDRYRMTDNITSLAGLQRNPHQHPQYAEFEKLSGQIHEMFRDYSGPLTADVLLAENGLWVLEISPHLHAPKLQGLRDLNLLGVWPGILVGKSPMQNLHESKTASAYVRIYGDQDTYEKYFDPSWIVDVETFPTPRQFGYHGLRKILYIKTNSSLTLQNSLEAFVNENGN